jgi:hypothetical protein
MSGRRRISSRDRREAAVGDLLFLRISTIPQTSTAARSANESRKPSHSDGINTATEATHFHVRLTLTQVSRNLSRRVADFPFSTLRVR